MNNPNPLVPQGSLTEQKNKSRSRVKVAFFCVVGIHVVGLMVLLMQGCKREQPQPPVDTGLPVMTETNLPPMDTNLPPVAVDTNIPVAPPAVDLAPPPPSAQEYVIQKGDSFYTIGKKLNVSMKAIKDANPNVNPSKLQIGQKIVIPAAAAVPVAGGVAPGVAIPAATGGEQSYVVKSGDTLTKIAKDHGTTVKALRAANNLKTEKIKVGDKLVIPAKAAAPAPAPVEPVTVTPAAPPGR
jgi:LysM repeat protein